MCGEYHVWVVPCVESAMCGECRVWRVMCGECRVWRVPCVVSSVCG